VLLARRAIQAVVEQALREGVELSSEVPSSVQPSQIEIYACGPWLPKIFPQLLRHRIRVTRQEVYFFGTPAGDCAFAASSMPVWIDITDEHGAYALPNIENRGFKLALDRHGPEFDPDTNDRIAVGVESARAFLAERFPGLAGAPLLESRVCQYSNTSTGDFLIDRHPDRENCWLVGGGSGHGFKHGPAVGEHVTALVEGKTSVQPRFALSKTPKEMQRCIY
jgi:sarcosine oxidase